MGIKKQVSDDSTGDTFIRHESPVTSRVEIKPPAPERAARLQCSCGCDKFWVTRVDFACTQCFKSYRD